MAVAQRLAICGEAGCIRIASDTWQLLRCSDAGTNVKSSSWHPSFKLLMGASDIVTCYSYQPVRSVPLVQLQYLASPVVERLLYIEHFTIIYFCYIVKYYLQYCIILYNIDCCTNRQHGTPLED